MNRQFSAVSSCCVRKRPARPVRAHPPSLAMRASGGASLIMSMPERRNLHCPRTGMSYMSRTALRAQLWPHQSPTLWLSGASSRPYAPAPSIACWVILTIVSLSTPRAERASASELRAVRSVFDAGGRFDPAYDDDCVTVAFAFNVNVRFSWS